MTCGRSRAPRQGSRIAPIALSKPREEDGLSAFTPGSGPAESHRPRPIPGEPTAGPAALTATRKAATASLRVLLAEDDPMAARSTSAVLRRLGHSVTHAIDGASAWKDLQARMGDFDVLLLDMLMPHMGGPELAQRARAAGFSGPIILMSGLIMHMDADVLAMHGVRRFMTKPFLPAELDRALRGE